MSESRGCEEAVSALAHYPKSVISVMMKTTFVFSQMFC